MELKSEFPKCYLVSVWELNFLRMKRWGDKLGSFFFFFLFEFSKGEERWWWSWWLTRGLGTDHEMQIPLV